MFLKRTIASTFTALLFSAFHLAFSQAPTLTKLTPPSPNVAAYQKYGDIPVSAYTGIPDISIPIYTVKFRDISFPISISYHASGIKVSEESSQVGLGWVLNAGGTISRNIVGDDDFNAAVYFNGVANNVMDFTNTQGPTMYVQTGCNLQMFNKTNPNQPTIYNYDITSYLTNSPPDDFQPDQYYYNYPGHSGKFILKRNMQAVLQKQESIQITCNNTSGTSWQIVSAEGYVYDFNTYETYSDPMTHISAWYLTKITSPAGNSVTFNYNTVSNYVQSVGSYSETVDSWYFTTDAQGGVITPNGNQLGAVPGKQYTNKYLTSIDFTNGRVTFNYSTGRTDLPNDPKLDSISIYNQGAVQPLKTFAFTYDYFNGGADQSFNTGSPGSLAQRLKLTQVTEKGYNNGQSIQNPPYIFTYNEMNNSLPAKTSFARDHWGYYNGVTNKHTLIPSVIPLNTTYQIAAQIGLMGQERDPNPFWAQAFILNSIKYPTGGWTEFQFESNDFDETQSQINDHSYFTTLNGGSPMPVETTATIGYDAVNHNYTGASTTLDLTNEYVSNGPGGGSPQVTVQSTFRFSGGTGGNCNDVSGGPGQMYYRLKDAGGGVISQIDPFTLPACNSDNSNSPCIVCQAGSPVITFSNSYTLSPGKYTWDAYVGTTGAALKLQDIHSTYSWYEIPTPNSTQVNLISVGGGLRVKRIIDHDGVSETNNKVRKYVYHYFADKTNSGVQSEYSYGRRMSKPEYAYFVLGNEITSQSIGGGCVFHSYYSLHLTRCSDSENPLNGSASGSPVGYDQVTELTGENGEYGKKVFQYLNNPDYVINYGEPFSGLALPLRPTLNSNLVEPLNGSLLNETDYANVKGKFYKVKENINQYTSVSSNESIVYGAENRVTPMHMHGDMCAGTPANVCDGNSVTLTYQNMRSEWTYMTSSDEKIYNQQGDEQHYTENLTNFYYDNPAHLQLTRTVTSNSKGEQITSTSRYPLDFSIPGGANDAFTQGLQYVIGKHMVSIPIEKYVQKQKGDGTNIGAVSYVLTSFANSVPAPALAYASMLSAPNTSFTASSVSTSGLVKDAAYQPLIYFDYYDAYGNLIQQHKVNDVNGAYIWDYNNSLVVAEASNSGKSEIAFTSFEADGSGNWTISGGTTNTSLGFTGKQSYTIGAGNTITKNGVTSGRNYIVSYWSRNGALNVNGVAATSGLTKNGWTYYQHLLPNTTTNITVSGIATIDELRLLPADAQMTTYTYSPLIGITSVCSPNNVVQYYLYDALGRLIQIVDQDGNIIKTLEYHYQNQIGS